MSTLLSRRFQDIRNASLGLCQNLSAEDCLAQSMPDASPIKWHLAHTTWFFETFILEKYEKNFRPFHSSFRVLFNSYYNGIGEKHPRPQRGLLTRPSLEEVKAYRANVDSRILEFMATIDFSSMGDSALAQEFAELIEIGLQHEQQHQELMLTDLKHLFSMNPLFPAYEESKKELSQSLPNKEWLPFGGEVFDVGFSGSGFCFDNELPKHRQFLEPYRICSRLVTNNEFLGFIEAGGYEDSSLWLSEGWDWVKTTKAQNPFYWKKSKTGWSEFTLQGLKPLAVHSPVLHLSYFEADAFARWSDARLPTEFEWEIAAKSGKLSQAFGHAWQWTSSSYAPYPGYRTAEGALGEYNGKFMCNQYVLRGSSLATPKGHERLTYRNFFQTSAQWQFSGIRLAKNI